jgi:hypothetical protein
MAPLAFDFITDDDFRSGLEADYREIELCLEQGAWKAVHVLAGSMIEAVLVDYLLGSGVKAPDPLKMTFADLIKACAKADVLSEKTAELSNALKAYRNLIHPGRSKRLNERADADGAIVARALVSIIVREVAEKQQESYGLTAEQIVRKFESDPSALGISEHLLKAARDQEIERVLTKVLPERYFEELQAENPNEGILDGQCKLFRAAFDLAPTKTKKAVMERYVAVLKEEPGLRVRAYEEEFFRASDIEFVNEPDRPLVKAHLIERIRNDPNLKLLRAAEGIGEWIEKGDVRPFVDVLMRHIVVSRAGGEILARRARKLLADEASNTPDEVDPEIIARLEVWESAYQSRGLNDQVEAIREIKRAFEVFQDLPDGD